MAAAPAPAKGGNILTRKFGPLPGWAWAGIGVAGYYIYKQRQASAAAAAAAAAANSSAGTSALAGAGVSAPSGYGYQGAGVGSSVSPGYTPPATTTSSTTSTPSTGYGTITINGQQYVVLGPAGGSVFQVGGGAPVFFGTANGVAQGPAAQQQAAANGGYAYTPIQYSQYVSATPTQQAPGTLA